ncbi:alpha-2-macroglobulin-like protein 1 isoform X1 [Paramacrobiotus metropolitanus]|uniref:alpha-2-macroglobulin-like protein 1 isoform X1 n=1 Tax=Paramacrobiotus metropolitanus TaxID=2943436 RepID=UPI0024461ED3|nr:alpha-2-macroglobulin-like protein 1 isoform X1 [Paramacrobiotus metropolitanus]
MVGIMQFLHIFLPTLMWVSTAGSATGIQYVVFGLNSARSNSLFPVSILVLNATSEVRIDMALIGRPPATSYGLYSNYDSGEMLLYASASLKGDDRFLVFNASAVIQANKLAHLEIDVGDLSAMVKEPMVFVLNGSDPSDSFRTGFSPIKIENNETTTVTKKAKTKRRPVVFIQTDQPLYKANDTVRFRVVSVESVDGHLRPVFVPFNVQILDPQRNIVQMNSNANDSQVVGYFSGEMPLSSDPLLGSWTVRVVRANTSVKVICPNYVTSSYATSSYSSNGGSYGGSSSSYGSGAYGDGGYGGGGGYGRKKRYIGFSFGINGGGFGGGLGTTESPSDSDPSASSIDDDGKGCNAGYDASRQYSVLGLLASKDFSVEEFVLPRFDVRIVTSRSYIVPQMQEDFRFQVVANYTFKEPAKGSFEVTVLRPRRVSGYGNYGSFEEKDLYDPVWNQTIYADKNGTASISVPAQFLSNLTDASKIIIRANFTEAATGQQWNATPATVSVKTQAYNIIHQADTKTFMPGYPYFFEATLTGWDGRPPPPSTKKVLVGVMGYSYSEGHSTAISSHGTVRCLGQTYPSPYGGSYGSSSYGGGGYGYNRNFGFGMTGSGYSYSPGGVGCSPLPDQHLLEVAVDGTINATFPTWKNAAAMTIAVFYEATSQAIILFAKQSPSGSFLEISQVTSDLRADKLAEFAINTTTRTEQNIHILVLSSSNASFLWSDSISRSGQYVRVSVPIVTAMGASGRLIAYYVGSDGELVGNIKALSVANDTQENVTLSAQAKNGLSYAEPGAEISIRAHSSPSAFMAFLAVDESMLLLKSGNDITQNVLDTKPKPQQRMQPSYMLSVEDYFTKAIDSGRVQQFLLTNTKLSTTSIPRAQDYYSSSFGNNQGFGFGSGGGSYDSYAGYSSASYGSGYGSASPFDSGLQQSAQTRKDFRQSFLFETAWADANGDVKLERKVPDAITTWQITAFSLSNTSGLTVSTEPFKLKVLKSS